MYICAVSKKRPAISSLFADRNEQYLLIFAEFSPIVDFLSSAGGRFYYAFHA